MFCSIGKGVDIHVLNLRPESPESPPPILPESASLHTLLWHAHYYLAFAFFAIILLHVAAILFHKLIRRDGVFETMAPVLTQHQSG